MSFSFGFTVANKELARAKVQAELDNVVIAQPVHAKDKALVLATFDNYLAMISDEATKPGVTELSGSVSGSVSGTWSGSDLIDLTSVNLSISVYVSQIRAK